MRSLGWTALLTLLLAAAFPPVLGAEDPTLSDPVRGGLLFRDGDDGRVLPAPILGTTVEVRVTGIVARTKVTQIFANPAKAWVEGLYLFPLPEGGAVDSLRLRIGERLVEGVIQEKGEARQTYEAAKQEGAKTALVEQLRPNVFTTSVANVGPGETVEVEIELQQIVSYDDGRFSLRFPMVVAHRYTPPDSLPIAEDPALPAPPVEAGANPFAFHVDLAPGFPLSKVASPTHNVSVVQGRSQRWALDLADGLASADSDFVLEWTPAVGREPRGVFFVEEVGGERYALLMVMPPDAPQAAAPRVPREAVFIIDVSGSMQGEPLEQARRALLVGLDGLAPGDWFNVIRFHDKAEALFDDSVPARPDLVEEARAWVKDLKIDGGTNILAPLELALESQELPGLVGQVVLATDGQVGNEAEILRFAAKELGSRRLFTVGIGTAPNSYFLRKLAEIGRGTWTQIDKIDEVEQEMGTLLSRLTAPQLTDLAVRWADPRAESFPAHLPDLYPGEPLIAATRLLGSEKVEIAGLSGGKAWTDAFPAAAVVQGAGLDKLWARRKIEALSDSLRDGADAEAVRKEIVHHGLAHHLVTAHTSLVAVDVERVRPPEVELAALMVPVSAPRGSGSWAGGSGGIQECITVSTESPLLDDRRISTGTTMTAKELERIPGSRDPWVLLRATPGVLTDRVNVGGNETGQVSAVVGAGAGGASWSLDGLIITDMSAISAPGYYDFDSFEELQVATGGTDAALAAPTVQVKLVTKRGTNEWRGEAEAAAATAATAETAPAFSPRVEDLGSLGLDLGGPLLKDQLWLWGSLKTADIERTAAGGQAQHAEPRRGALKVNHQFASDNSAVVSWTRGELSSTGEGASPSRAPETTWDRRGHEDLWSLEDSHVVSSNLYFTATISRVEHRREDRPGATGEALLDAAGVARGGWFAASEESRSDRASLSSSWFSNSDQVSHERVFGASWEAYDLAATLAPPSRLTLAGSPLGLPAGISAVELWRGGRVDAGTDTVSLWAQDLATWGSATAALGLRWDRQDLGTTRSAGTLAPRLAFTYAWDRDLLLRATASRFASRLGTAAAVRLHPEIPAAAVFFDDGAERTPWYGINFDVARPGVNPNAVDAGLEPELTDELTVSIERAFYSDFVVGLSGSWRRIHRILEERLLVRDLASGSIFAARATDWVPLGTVAGLLPDGTAYGVPVFDLRPGRAPTGGTLLVNGDRQQSYRGLTLLWHKRLSNSWMTRGHFTRHDWTWRTGDDFARFDDPTNVVGSGADDGQAVVGRTDSPLLPHEAVSVPSGRWSFYWVGLVELPADVSLAAAVNGRDGFALPYVRRVARPIAGIADLQLTGRADAVRTEDLWTLDARLSKDFNLGEFELTADLEAVNLLDADTVVARQTDLGVTRGGAVDELLAPRTWRLGLRLQWR